MSPRACVPCRVKHLGYLGRQLYTLKGLQGKKYTRAHALPITSPYGQRDPDRLVQMVHRQKHFKKTQTYMLAVHVCICFASISVFFYNLVPYVPLKRETKQDDHSRLLLSFG